MNLPVPPWLEAGGAPGQHWLYPLHRMAPGDRIFVAATNGYADLAVRTVGAYRRLLWQRQIVARFTATRTVTGGIQGVVIRRLS